MTYTIAFITSTIISFWAHHFGERFFTGNRTKNIRLVVKGFQVHHSFWGVLVIAIATVFTGGVIMFALLGYGLGNIWQHKKTHNAINERGMVFISKIVKR